MVLNWEVRLFKFLNGFLFSKEKPCLLLVALSGHGLLICIVYTKPSINVSNLSIFRSIIHLNIKLCEKNNKNNKFSLRMHSTQLLGKKYHATAAALAWYCNYGRDSVIMIPWDPR